MAVDGDVTEKTVPPLGSKRAAGEAGEGKRSALSLGASDGLDDDSLVDAANEDAQGVETTAELLARAGEATDGTISGTELKVPTRMTKFSDDRLPPTRIVKYLHPGRKIKERHEDGNDSRREVMKYIASGSFGDVYETFHLDTEVREAMKIVCQTRWLSHEGSYSEGSIAKAERVRRLRPHIREAHIMTLLGSHPNLVGIRGAYLLDNDFYIFMDLIPGCTSLSKLMRGVDERMSLERAAVVGHHGALGLEFMEQRGFVHWDFKSDNVLVGVRGGRSTDFDSCPTGALIVKIGDFGSTTRRVSGEFVTCSRSYCSPETYDAYCHTTRSGVDKAEATQDVWSWGVVLMELILGRKTWDSSQAAKQVSETLEAKLSRRQQTQRHLSGVCVGMVKRCLDRDANRRPALATIVQELSRFVGEAFGPVSPTSDHAEPAIAPRDLATLHKNLGYAYQYQLAVSREDYDIAQHHRLEFKRIAEATWGAESAKYAEALTYLAWLYKDQGNYDEAKPLYDLAIEIDKKALGPQHPSLATSYHSLAELHVVQGNYDEAKPLYDLAIEIKKKALGPEHPSLATSYHSLAQLHVEQGNYDEAKPLYDLDIEITKKALGPEHPELATSYHSLAQLHVQQANYDEAKPLYELAIEIYKKTLGPEHPWLAASYHGLAHLHVHQGNYDEAKPLYDLAIEIKKKALGPEHPWLGVSYRRLAELHVEQGNYDEAKPLYDLAIEIQKKALGHEHPKLATSYHSLAGLLSKLGSHREALSYMDSCVGINDKKLPVEHPHAKRARIFHSELKATFSGSHSEEGI